MNEDPRTEEQKAEDRRARAARIEHLTKCVGMPPELAEIVEDLSNHAVVKAVESLQTVADTAPAGLESITHVIALQMLHFNIGTALRDITRGAIVEALKNGTVIILGHEPGPMEGETGDGSGPDTFH